MRRLALPEVSLSPLAHAGVWAAFWVLGACATASAAAPASSPLLQDERNSVEVFQRVSPSVVFITNAALRRDWFTMDVTAIPQGTGSGFVWDRAGHIVTNFHVVRGAQALSVKLMDGTSYEARLVGVDPTKDIAVLQIEAPAEALQPVRVGRSSALQVGRKVLAIGNPFGLDHTLTTGVVSALGREIDSLVGRKIRDVIQTDAAINPGNSGGPLLNSAGELVGMNTSILSKSGASDGIGFAVPADTIARVVPQIIRYGRVLRPGLGVELVQDAVARANGIRGVVIYRVPKGSAAARAGLRGLRRSHGELLLGDVIVAVEQGKVETYEDLATALERHRVGDTVTLGILRDGKIVRISVTLQPVR